jgi:hypothetical protein
MDAQTVKVKRDHMIFLASPQLNNVRMLTQAAVLLACISEVLGSNFSHNIILTGFLWVF